MTVYFIQAGGVGGPIKIGYTEDTAQSRIRNMQTGNAKRLRCLLEIEGGPELEASLHREFWSARIRGEWFHPVSLLKAKIIFLRPQEPRPEDVTHGDPALSLRTYLDENSLLVKDLARMADLKPWDISRLLSGERKKPSTRIALGIDKATEGAIPFRAWFEDEAA